ncbi:MAG: mannose-phosphate guanylyltransferase [Petroclostridium sp.]|jgi:mannose-1-phosphate guanylyltransferase|uniref:nucleotidyltransferase family protein n=1 Tax=Petroclostridium xylanilyticum TaxID=1792311 RepID=UPI000B9850BC|nr:NDP-sugar synthase [Petroclostridium xylanilyticum]MBZ4647099.1 Mannose-phosphate guanylyltransferase [Clostridia bacterium]MDK2809417.1 mannose-phosphate guanylyltransferase [Petroclostridium sp.]
MKALLLAGGRGTRLQPLTNNIPKPMVPIVGKPLLERTIANLKKNGINEIILSTCYQSQYIKNYFGDGKQFGVKIHYISEDIPLGTGGAVKQAEKYFDDTFVVLNSDILSDIDVGQLIEHHRNKSCIATIAVTEVKNPSQYGVIEYDSHHYITSFKEKPQAHEIASNFINAGIYVFEPQIFNEIPSNRVVSIEKETYPMLLNKGYKMAAYEMRCYWMDIGTPEKYIQAHKDILNAECKIFSDCLMGCSHVGDLILKGKNTRIHPEAKIVGPVYVGENVNIEAYAFVGPHAVIGDGSSIAMGSRVVGSVLWDHVRVGRGARLVNTVIASNCRIDGSEEVYNTVYTEDVLQPVAI